MLDRFFEMFQNITLAGIIIVVLIIVAIVLVAVLIARARAKRGAGTPKNKRFGQNMAASKNKTKAQVVSIPGMKMKDPVIIDKWANAPLYVSDKDKKARGEELNPEEEASELETIGDFPAYIIRQDVSLDYGIIHQPLGDVFMAGPSMPKGGACYLVREKENSPGKYEDYDPRTAPLISDSTPVKAWFATHWDIVRQVFSVPTPWYKSISLWIAAVTGVLAFIIVMATIGG